MSMWGYLDGSNFVVVECGMPEHHVEIGIGSSWHEALDSREATAIQSTGPDSGLRAAMSWAHGAGWISDPSSLDEADDELEEYLRESSGDGEGIR